MKHALRSHATLRTKLYQKLSSRLGLKRELRRDNLPREDTTPLTKLPSPPESEEGIATLIQNARILSRPEPVNIAIANGRILTIDRHSESAPARDQATQLIDAQGHIVLPAFTDSHLHLLVGAERVYGCDLEGCTTLQELTERIQAFTRDNPTLAVIHAYGLAYLTPALLPAASARKLLDTILADKPLFVYAHDLHTGWANTRALQEADMFTEMPPWPPLLEVLEMTESITLGSDNRPGGELREPEAYFLVEGSLRSKYPLTPEQKLHSICRIAEKMHKNGISTIHNMGLALPEEDLETLILLLELEHKHKLNLRVHSSISVVPDANMLGDIRLAAEVRDLLHSARAGKIPYSELHGRLLDMLEATSHPRQQHISLEGEDSIFGNIIRALSQHLHAVHAHGHHQRRKAVQAAAGDSLLPQDGLVECQTIKLFLDGVVEKDTAYRSDQAPLPSIPAFTPDTLREVVCLADRAGLQVAAHCIGDESVSMLLDAVAAARRENHELDRRRGHRIRHRIEHIEICKPADLPRFARLGVIASMQPLHERPPVQLWHKKIPESAWSTAFAWRSLLERQAILTFGSDWPIVPADCIKGIERAVNRNPWTPTLPPSNLSLEQAVAGYTTHAAYTVHEEQLRGALAPGMLADLLILNTTTDQAIDKAKISHTLLAGHTVYSRE